MRSVIRAAALAAAALSVVVTAGTAQAATTTANSQMSPNTGGNCDYYTSCTSLSNGELSVTVLDPMSPPNEVLDEYQKTGGSTIYADFEYNDGYNIHYDEGAFSQSAGQTKSYEWYNQYLSSCAQVTGILAVRGEGNFQTPPVYLC